jgi:hypothetical protein
MYSKQLVITMISAVLLSGQASALEQVVTPDQTRVEMTSTSTVSVAVNYETLTPASKGVNAFTQWVFYDASVLSVSVNAMYSGALGDAIAQADIDDLDNDPSTDTYFILSWLDLTFKSAWPGEYPVSIYNLDVSTKKSSTGSSQINLLRDENNAVRGTTYRPMTINIVDISSG